MHSPLVSVVVPIYNGEKYLSRCINSILGQTYTNIDLLLIDDGSTDNSYEICSKYAHQDNRIRIFKQENQGVSAARNCGITHAAGDYITFCDCDDELKEDFLSTAILDCQQHNLDLWIGTTIRIVNGRETGRNEPWERFLANTDELTEQQMLSIYYASSCISAKVWRKSFISDVRFREGMNYGEDLIFAQTLMLQKGRMLACPTIVYIYHLLPTGITASVSAKKVTSLVECALILREYAGNRHYPRNGQFYRFLDEGWCHDLQFIQFAILRSDLHKKEKTNYLKHLLSNQDLYTAAKKENWLNVYPRIRYLLHYCSSAMETVKTKGCTTLLKRVKGYFAKR